MAEKIEMRARQKRKLFEEGMKQDHVMLHLDARKPGVEVPAHLADNPSLTLKLSYLFQGKTTHDEQGVTAYLKFSGEYYQCVVPWDAVWGLTTNDQKNQIWAEEVPREVVLQLTRAKIIEAGRKLLGRDKSGDRTDEPDAQAAQPGPQPNIQEETQTEALPDSKRPHLRRIK